MDSSMCTSAPDFEMWIIQGTLAWRIGGTIRVRSNVNLTFDSPVRYGRSKYIMSIYEIVWFYYFKKG
ncbi:uncharacterized protein ycf68 [Phtheirospermum japonicum]|uniref:Uncharacterized protein ycf68 n=1 Tax=Phtheirospermum japonicum TaxID=374723 RepID=A0A830CSG0_9LAMI|nr:uncharacterized protein ycf68 [Phtheirospermum japonicum]